MPILLCLAGVMPALLVASCSTTDTTGPDRPQTPPPPPSAGHALVYHDGMRAVLLVNAGLGGMTSPPPDQRTRIWAWDGTNWRIIDSAGPPIRNLGGVAYDQRRQVVVLHGGSYSLERGYGETWEWHRVNGWRQFEGPGPGKRDHTQMAYDAERGRIVLFGGQVTLDSFPADTWLYDGARWEQVLAPGPAPRVHHAMQYDPIAKEIVLFGGFQPKVADLGDTWAWEGARWARRQPDRQARTHARMAFDRELGGMVLIGGGSAPMLLREAAGWRPVDADGPAERYLPGVSYDSNRGVLVLFGGGDPHGSLFDDTWEFDGRAWRRAGSP